MEKKIHFASCLAILQYDSKLTFALYNIITLITEKKIKFQNGRTYQPLRFPLLAGAHAWFVHGPYQQ